MGRPRREVGRAAKADCVVAVDSLNSLVLKLLDSADASDEALKTAFLSFENKVITYAGECQSLRTKMENLLREKENLCSDLYRMEKDNRKLSEEAQRLQRQLEVIREVLRDTDIDEVKERLAKLDTCSWVRSSLPKRVDHSAGSLLDSDNTSNGEFEIESQSSKYGTRKKSRSIGCVLRRSTRLTGSKIQDPCHQVQNGNVNLTKSGYSRKRISSNSAESYHDITFKRAALDKKTDSGSGLESVHAFEVGCEKTSSNDCFTTPVRPTVRANRLTRLHQFLPISSLRLQMCGCCGKRFAIGKPALKCKVCRLVVHGSCQQQLKQRCVPPTDLSPSPTRTPRLPRAPHTTTPSRRHIGAPAICPSPAAATPLSASRRHHFSWHSITLASLCPPNEFPQIPAPVIHCVNEVATRGLLQVGIYRVPGAEKKVFELLDKFMHGRTTPSLALVEDINVVCSCLKAFFRLLSEPLVTYSLRPEFIETAELSLRDSEGAKYRVATLLDKLPIANRDTLAFIILHLKAVSRSSACRMGESNLAKVFGFTLVGHSCPEPTLTQIANEVNGQQSVVRLLLSVPDAVYSTILI